MNLTTPVFSLNSFSLALLVDYHTFFVDRIQLPNKSQCGYNPLQHIFSNKVINSMP